ncbi:hypothetical protein CRM22_002014 [Opisthorchis felineus]|uniref:Uncharacterized protein n=1 Tax=Opisthorchis felineus TaxID=147828 RepID=A0A4S2MED8_OPIFE|nr:hypothetical protein CRM22_002014 [Opisthorchis felineus]TGZ72548.1 hypothetical protein CRM22_002014 [Opisthorchis felineus]
MLLSLNQDRNLQTFCSKSGCCQESVLSTKSCKIKNGAHLLFRGRCSLAYSDIKESQTPGTSERSLLFIQIGTFRALTDMCTGMTDRDSVSDCPLIYSTR